MFAPEGTRQIVSAALVGAALAVVGVLAGGWGGALVVVGGAVVGGTLWFFRDPARTPPPGADVLLLAPADGKVVEIADEHEPLYLKGPSQRVSIFLSPFDVHVNRSPATGTVEFERYVPGDYLVAWHPKASERNERSEIGLRHFTGAPVLFRQIAGAVARRVVYDAPVGARLRAGERFGIIKFGSRMDVVVPPHVELDVAVGQRTVAGETVIGRLPAAASGDGATSNVGTLLPEVA